MHPLAQTEFLHGYFSADDRDNDRLVRGGAHREYTSIGQPPCDGCPLATRCRDSLLACAQFAAYVETGKFGRGYRVPHRALFRAIMAS